MSLTLKDLRVATAKTSFPELGYRYRPASLADLVEVLKQEGVKVWWCDSLRKTTTPRLCGREEGRVPSARHEKCGPALVLPLEDTPK